MAVLHPRAGKNRGAAPAASLYSRTAHRYTSTAAGKPTRQASALKPHPCGGPNTLTNGTRSRAEYTCTLLEATARQPPSQADLKRACCSGQCRRGTGMEKFRLQYREQNCYTHRPHLELSLPQGSHHVRPEDLSRLSRPAARAVSGLRRETARARLPTNEHPRLQTLQRNRPDRLHDVQRSRQDHRASGLCLCLSRSAVRSVLSARFGRPKASAGSTSSGCYARVPPARCAAAAMRAARPRSSPPADRRALLR